MCGTTGIFTLLVYIPLSSTTVLLLGCRKLSRNPWKGHLKPAANSGTTSQFSCIPLVICQKLVGTGTQAYAPCVNVHWLDLFNNLQPGFWLSATKQPSIRNSSNGVASGSGGAMWEDLKRFPVHEMPYILFYFQLSRIFIFKCLQGLCDPV